MPGSDMYPLLVFLVGVTFVVVTIIRFHVHPFLALIFGAVIVGVLADQVLPGDGAHAVRAVDLAAREFGNTAASIGIVIVLAAIIGTCLMDSGAADVITRRFLKMLGLERAPLALLGSGYVLSIPVFFDTVFYLLVPLAKALRVRTGQSYVLYVMAICAGGILTHSLVAPTPGPLIMASNLHIDLGTTIVAGFVASILPAILVGYYFSRWVSRRLDIPLRETPGTSIAELEETVRKSDSELPPFWLSILPIALPVLLITAVTISSAMDGSLDSRLTNLIAFAGNRNIALLISAVVAVLILVRQLRVSLVQLKNVFEPAIASAGIIILITAAGGAFGAMIRHAGVGEVILAQVGETASGTALLLAAFGLSSVMKIAQGSSTVAMITASAIMYGVTQGMSLPFHPVYLFLAIGFGAMVFSWMNDSGFWIVCKMSGFTETETLKTLTVMLALLGIVGFVQILVVSSLLPLT